MTDLGRANTRGGRGSGRGKGSEVGTVTVHRGAVDSEVVQLEVVGAKAARRAAALRASEVCAGALEKKNKVVCENRRCSM